MPFFRFLSLSLMILPFMLNGCSKESSTTAENHPSSGMILPLQIGNKWTWQEATYDTSGAIVANIVDSSRVPRDTVDQTIRWYLFTQFITNAQGIFASNRSNGLWFWELDSGALFYHPQLVWKYPATKSDKYYIYPSWGVSDSLNVTVCNTDTVVTVPAGSFHCYKYAFNDEGQNQIRKFYVCFSPGVGEILHESIDRTQGNRIYIAKRRTLLSYKVN